MVFIATARWNFRGEAWFSVEIEAADLNMAGALFYSMLPITFFRGKERLISIRPRDMESFDPKILASAPPEAPDSVSVLLEAPGPVLDCE